MLLDLASFRLVLCIIHLMLASLGAVNLLVIFVILVKPSLRIVTNVYMAGLCFADFVYVADLAILAIAQLKNNWYFGYTICHLYWATETTSKYATVLFVVLMAFDRYCALCKRNWRRFRSFYLALTLSTVAWTFSAAVASPVFLNVSVEENIIHDWKRNINITRIECKPHFQGRKFAGWYVFFTALVIFFLPLLLIIYFYYHVLIKMRKALQTSRRISRSASARAPYQRVTYFVLTVILAHIFAWAPFWTHALYASLKRLKRTLAMRVLLNIMHLLPYINCAANPFIYLANFRLAFQSALEMIFFCKIRQRDNTLQFSDKRDTFEPTTSRLRYGNGLIDSSIQCDEIMKLNYIDANSRTADKPTLTYLTILKNPTATVSSQGKRS